MGNQHGSAAGGGAAVVVATNGTANGHSAHAPASFKDAATAAAAGGASASAASSSPQSSSSSTEPPTPPASAAAITASPLSSWLSSSSSSASSSSASALAAAALPSFAADSTATAASAASAAAAVSSLSAASSSFPVGEKFYGLENTNNICYCNSVLQALYACRPFRQQLLVYHEESRARRGKEADTLLSCLSSLFYRIQTSRKPRGVVSASAFVRKLKKANEQFDSFSHQDAQEFLIFLLNNLSDTLQTEQRDRLQALSNAASATPPQQQPVKRSALSALFSSHSSAPSPPAAAPDASTSSALRDMSQLSAATAMGSVADKSSASDHSSSSPHIAEHFYATTVSSSSSAAQHSAAAASSLSSAAAVSSPGTAPASSAASPSSSPAGSSSSPPVTSPSASWVQALFEGRLTNVTECIRCGCVSQRDESFLDLSVDLMEHRSLTACLRAFSHEEMLNGADKFLCDSCGCRQEAVKSLKLKRLPPVLLLHMKRFKYSEQIRGFSKLCYRIAFPLTLRLDSSCGGDDADNTDDSRGKPAAAASGAGSGARQPLYELTAVVVHIGNGARSGHYVCMCRGSNGQFYLYDDSTISAISEDDVRATFGTEMGGSHQDGYLLFYSRESELTTEDRPLQLQSIATQGSRKKVETAAAADGTAQNGAVETKEAAVGLIAHAAAAPITVS